MRTIFAALVFAILLSIQPLYQAAAAAGAIQTVDSPVLAYAGSDGNIYMVNQDGTQRVRLTNDGQKQADPAAGIAVEYESLQWSPDGRSLAAMRTQTIPQQDRLETQNQVVVIDIASGTARSTGITTGRYAWAADSSALLHGLQANFGSNGVQAPFTGIYRYDLVTGTDSEMITAENYPLSWPQVSATGRYLAFYETIAMDGLGYFGMVDFQNIPGVLGDLIHLWKSAA